MTLTRRGFEYGRVVDWLPHIYPHTLIIFPMMGVWVGWSYGQDFPMARQLEEAKIP